MAKGKNRNILLLYGLFMGLLLIVLQGLNYKALIRDLSIEVYGAIVALVFLTIGLGLGYLGFKKWGPAQRTNSVNTFSLSPREMDVLRLMAQGLTNKEIADRLYVSLNTIKTHTSNIYSKLNVERRTQAVSKAREYNLLH